MAYIAGEAGKQVTMFPETLDEFIPEHHLCRVMEALVNRLEMGKLGTCAGRRQRRDGGGRIRATC